MKLACATAPKRDSLHWTQTSVTWDELCAWAEDPSSTKEAGNYLLGTLTPNTTVTHKDKNGNPRSCTNTHRRKDFVVSRSAITLDVDFPSSDFADTVDLTLPYRALLHTTYSSAPDEPRYRLIIPTDREMAPDEYVTAATAVVQQLGKEQFDPGTTQPERYMFRPAAQQRDWYHHSVVTGPVARVDDLLTEFVEDLSLKPIPKARVKRDPFEIEGAIGAFNRAYRDWDLLIKTYDLPYDRVAEDRYQLIGARSQAGMGPIQDTDGLVYSHHSNDPAYGKTCSAFDLVRLHRFSDLDEDEDPRTPVNRLPSHSAMLELAANDPRVTAELVGTDFESSVDDWRMDLQMQPKTGIIKDVIANWDLITNNDPAFAVMYYNQLTFAVELDGPVPWREVTEQTRTLTTTDRWQVCHYVERKYRFRPAKAFMDSLIDTTASRRTVNPVRDYLESLNWDGKERLDTCLPGVADTPYTRLVARKSMVAAVARALEPGIKWDHTLVLFGPEGIGKSWWVHKMARGHAGSLGSIQDKDTLIAMQRSWIMLADESHSIQNGGHDQQKEFLTRTEDMFRMPYDREVMVHPRRCVIWSTTNEETFLRRQEGNRRFLIVHCEERVDFDRITDAYIDQVWAEAVYYFRRGERLYLGDIEAETAQLHRERFIEEDAMSGMIQEHINTLVPADWWEMSREARRQWHLDRADGFVPEGNTRLDVICSMQIWVEALGRRYGEARRGDLLEINNAIKRIPGWVAGGRRRVPGYGPQLVFVRDVDSSERDLL